MFNTHSVIEVILILAGAGQLALALSSLAIPYLLDWREELQALKPLTRGVFWTYSSYTFATNVWFGVVSIAAAGPLAARGLLARRASPLISPSSGVRERLFRGTRNVACGVVLFLVARRLPLVPAVLVALPALSLILHFGVCLIVAAGWRAAGFDVDDIFREPWSSRSLAEFWSRRW